MSLGVVVACFIAIGSMAVTSSGCMFCTDELRSALSGTITSADGQLVVPDVIETIKDGRTEPCEMWADQYSCYERGEGWYTLRIEVNGESWEWDLHVGADGCHVEPREFDAVLVRP